MVWNLVKHKENLTLTAYIYISDVHIPLLALLPARPYVTGRMTGSLYRR